MSSLSELPVGAQGAPGDRCPRVACSKRISEKQVPSCWKRMCLSLKENGGMQQAKDLGRKGGSSGTSCLIPAHATNGQTEPGQG